MLATVCQYDVFLVGSEKRVGRTLVIEQFLLLKLEGMCCDCCWLLSQSSSNAPKIVGNSPIDTVVVVKYWSRGY